MKLRLAFSVLVLAANLSAALDDSLKKLIAVGHEGEGNEAATSAWDDVVKAGPSAILPILNAMGKGDKVSDNWLRLAAGVIADKASASKAALPLADLESFLRDVKHASPARQLAFDLIQQSDATKADAIEPTLLNDPSQELRRGAVQRLITDAKSKQGDAAKSAFRAALDAARDEDQVKTIADALEKLGDKPDLPKHFGFLMKWNVIGPFDNAKREGFDKSFPPEKEIKLDAEYEGKDGAKIKWQPYETKQDYGKVDFNKPLGMLKETTAYAVTTFDSSEERDAELRLGCKNGWKVWLNGELLFGRDEYHRGAQLDQYKMKCHLKKGANTVLVKCCQNEQKETWTVEWEFQLRVCDAAGTAILAAK